MKKMAILSFSLVLAFLAFAHAAPTRPEVHEIDLTSPPVGGPEDLSMLRVFVVGGMIVVTPRVTVNQTTYDVLESMLLFQKESDKKYNRNSDLTNWIQLFDTTAKDMCWTSQDGRSQNVSIKNTTFTIANITLMAMSQDPVFRRHVPTMAEVMGIIKRMPSTSNVTKTLKNFTYDSKTHDTAVSFGIYGNVNGHAHLRRITVSLTGVEKPATNITLFNTYKTSEVKTKSVHSNTYMFDMRCYGAKRAEVEKTLGSDARKYIIPINSR